MKNLSLTLLLVFQLLFNFYLTNEEEELCNFLVARATI